MQHDPYIGTVVAHSQRVEKIIGFQYIFIISVGVNESFVPNRLLKLLLLVF